MGKSSKISFSRTSFFVKGVPKKVHRVKGRKISLSRRSKGILKRASRKKRITKRRRRKIFIKKEKKINY